MTSKSEFLSIPKIHIERNDCFAFLEGVKEESIDLILIDPPYEISRKTGFQSVVNGVERFGVSMDFGNWDHEKLDLETIIPSFYRVLKKGGTAIIFYDLWKITPLSEALKQSGFKQLRFLEWLKTNPVPLNSKVNYLTNAREIAISAVKGGRPKFHSSYDNGIYEFPIYQGKERSHPTQKPVKLFEALIEKHSDPGDTVLDCFLGSGTTAVACKRTGRNFTGCELDETYCKNAIKRVDSLK
ncbi:MAG: DNA modification methylase [Campylobacteraceae bacterium 4484_4]|nr:MAG: DNA modification methylase [Campylobacteraceae bacterium 4484_4]